MESCNHLKNGLCLVSTHLAGCEVPAAEDACAACQKLPNAMGPNHVTYSKAIYTLLKEKKPVHPNLKEGLRPNPAAGIQGVGNELAKIYKWFGYGDGDKEGCSSCNSLRNKMNSWGPEKCRQNKKRILVLLRRSCNKRGIPFNASKVWASVELAIANHRLKTSVFGKTLKSNKPKAQEIKDLPMPYDPDWAVAVTTAPRKDCTLVQCLNSLRTAGWAPVVFAEPGSTPTGCPTIHNSEKLGVWRNWIKSVRWSLENTNAKYILTAQDDSLFHPDSKRFVESVMWPDSKTGFVSLYTPKHYSFTKEGTLRDPAVRQVYTRSLWGACALVWPREVLERIIKDPLLDNWRGVRPRTRSAHHAVMALREKDKSLIQNSDTAIGKLMLNYGRTMWFVDPSPVAHIARYSATNHGSNTGNRNAYRPAKHDQSLFDLIPLPNLKYDNVEI